MFVTKARHMQEMALVAGEYQRLREKYNILVRFINEKSGLTLLDDNVHPTFSQNELKLLLNFCQPNKHGDSPEAQRITRKLLRLKENQRK